ncbi:endoribonuclease YbeY-like isoform X1 [Entelurus aequoreus]|uniref:endoribonuclease YbeY-like isoform X1 n=1 Tax=Entelurus aequoreus TaxID=161455 RepID=UPI002B1E7069|nr:endoribonuclease YbeY-like isoform X1 [Entelurus aequoreus]XP_061923530.1 endoribonuclease YbeY-like isoform X1 [Entelurus aequoreus]
MSVVVRNLQKVVPLRRARLRKDADTIRHILGIRNFDLGIVCVDDRRIQQINHTYRRKDRPTDVLSFPFHEGLRPGKMPCSLHRDELNLGDIFLGVEFIMRQCQEDSLDLHGTLTVMIAHGICHLLGYRHETEEDWSEGRWSPSQLHTGGRRGTPWTSCHLITGPTQIDR